MGFSIHTIKYSSKELKSNSNHTRNMERAASELLQRGPFSKDRQAHASNSRETVRFPA